MPAPRKSRSYRRTQALERLQVRGAHALGFSGHLGGALDILESRRTVKGKRQLIRIQQLEHDDVIAARPEMPQPLDDWFRIVEQIGNQHDQAAPDQRLGQLLQRTGHVGAPPGAKALERDENAVQMAAPRAGREPQRNLLVEGDEPGGIALPVHQERQRAGQHGAVFELAHRRGAAIAHRSADVEQQVALDVRLFLILLDVVTVAARVDLPVERGEIVAVDVLAVLGELDAEALVRAAMKAREKSLHDRPRLQLHGPEPCDHGGIQKPQLASRGGLGHQLHPALRHRHRLEELADDRVGCDAFGLGVEVRNHAVAQHGQRQRLYVAHGHVVAAVNAAHAPCRRG